MSSRRVSLPVSLGVQRLSILRPAPIPTSRLSPASPRSPCGRRSLPTTPGGRRSLPGTPRNLSPRPHILPDLDEYLPTTPSTSSRNQFSLRDSGFMEANNNSCIKEDEGLPRSERSDGQLRSFDYKHGSVVDNGYQNKGIMKYVQKKRASDGEGEGSRTINFLLNDKEIELEILLESMLESSPFGSHLTMYIVVYNVDNRDSFIRAAEVLYRIYQLRRKNVVPVVLIGNKIDLKRNNVVSTIEGRSLAKIYKCSFAEVSALLSLNIDQMWTELIKQLENPTEIVTWVDRLVNRGRTIAKSCEEIVQRIMA
uniref:GTP-binding protein Rheb n=1 Tax=Heterorhabditis bacteriophora TaxID=37862 RepID=A0A1I7WRU8_HETBA